MCSDSRKRWLTTLLNKAHPDSWPNIVEPNDFYSVLHSFIQLPNGRDRFNVAAKKIEKKNRPIRFHEAMYKHLMARHGSSEELREIYNNLAKSNEGHINLFRWVAENESAEEAAHIVWSMIPQKADEIQSVIDQVKELESLLGPYAEYLAGQEASTNARTTKSSRKIDSAKSIPIQQSVEDNSVASVLPKLQEVVSQLTVESTDADQIENIMNLTSDLSAAHQERTARATIDMSIKNVIEDAYRALNDAGSVVDGANFDLPILIEKLSDDDVATTSSLTDALNVKNEKIRELQQQIQEAVSAELLAAMTDAVQCRDQYCQELKGIFGGDPASDETDVVAGHPEKRSRISVPAQHSSDEKVALVDTGDQDLDETVSAEGAAAEPVEKEAQKIEDAETSDMDVESTHKSTDLSRDLPSEASTDEAARKDRLYPSVEERLESYAIAGEVSKCYWLTWANAALGNPGQISPVALQCVAAAGELRPGVPPTITLRRGLSEVAKEDFSKFENRVLGIAAVIPAALFCQQNPTGLYTLTNQLRSSVGESSLDEIFDETIKACVDQGIWISERAISSVAVKSGHSERAREIIRNAEQFKAQLPHFNFSYRPAAEAFREMFRSRAGIGRALAIVADARPIPARLRNISRMFRSRSVAEIEMRKLGLKSSAFLMISRHFVNAHS